MHIKKYIWLVVGIMLIACLVLSGCTKTGPSSSEPVKIGFIGPFSGPMGDNGQQMLRGAKMAIKKINDDGGILGGRPVELVELDDQGDPAQSSGAARKGITVDKVKVICGTWDPGAGAAVWEVTNEAKMPFCQWGSGIDLIMHSYKGHIQMGVSPSAENYPVYDYLESHNLKTVVLCLEDFAWSRDCEALYRVRWDKAGSPVKILETIWVPLAKSDLTAEVTKAMSLNADAIVMQMNTPPSITASMQATTQLGYKGPRFGFGPLGDPAFIASLGAEANGVMLATWFCDDPSHQSTQDFIKAYQDQGFPGGPGDQVTMSYDNIMVAALGMDKAGTDSDTGKIADAWKNLKYQMICGDCPYEVVDYNGALRLNRTSRYMVTIEDGKMTDPNWFKFKENTIKMDEAIAKK
jgi:branched-chain amino acid transport system substrate-binding protein